MDVARGKLKGIVQHCIYEISTGKWEAGEKLPSVRKAEQLWGVNRLTVLGAYKELLEMGLVISKDRRGFFVASSQDADENKNQKDQLDRLYSKVKDIVDRDSNFDWIATLKYFERLAEMEVKESPTLGFVECSMIQAIGHADEIESKLNVHVASVLLEDDIKIPSSMQTLFTTGFHIQEVGEIGRKRGLEVINVPIEVDQRLFASTPKEAKSATIFELEEPMSEGIYTDVKKLSTISLRKKVVKDVDEEIAEFLASTDRELVLLSPRMWGAAKKKWRNNPRVQHIKFSIKKSAWPQIARAAKLPFNLNF